MRRLDFEIFLGHGANGNKRAITVSALLYNSLVVSFDLDSSQLCKRGLALLVAADILACNYMSAASMLMIMTDTPTLLEVIELVLANLVIREPLCFADI